MSTHSTGVDALGENTGGGSSARRSSAWLSWLFGIALLAAVLVAARHFSEARDFARLTERAEPWWLLLAFVCQAGTYLVQGQVFRSVARSAHSSLGLATASRLSLAKLFVDQAVPSGGLSGTVVLANGLQRRGLPRTTVAASIIVDLVSYYAAYVISLAGALVITIARGEESTLILLVFVVFVLFASALAVLVLVFSGRAARGVPRKLARLRVVRTALAFVKDADPHLARNPRLLLKALVYQLAIVLCDATTVWVLIRSLGGHGSPAGVFASFMISSLLRTIGFMPGGLGTFEAASIVTLRMVGVPVAEALAATLLFRGLSFWLPMLPGLWLARGELGRHRGRPSDSSREEIKAD